MTRTVTDAALMMAELSKPDWRDTMSLPWQDLAWGDVDQPLENLKGLRLGLLLDAGWGLKPDEETLAAVQAAARTFESYGAHVELMSPFTTREMIDGLDRFWRRKPRLRSNSPRFRTGPICRTVRISVRCPEWP